MNWLFAMAIAVLIVTGTTWAALYMTLSIVKMWQQLCKRLDNGINKRNGFHG